MSDRQSMLAAPPVILTQALMIRADASLSWFTDFEGVGQVIAALSLAYRGQAARPWQDGRLSLVLAVLRSAGCPPAANPVTSQWLCSTSS